MIIYRSLNLSKLVPAEIVEPDVTTERREDLSWLGSGIGFYRASFLHYE